MKAIPTPQATVHASLAAIVLPLNIMIMPNSQVSAPAMNSARATPRQRLRITSPATQITANTSSSQAAMLMYCR